MGDVIEVSEKTIIMTGSKKRLGYWMSQKKSKKLSFYDIENALLARNIEPVKIDLEQPLECQGPFHGILHKLTDFIASAELGDAKARKLIESFTSYLRDNPGTIIIDSIECLQTLIDRYKTYCVISKHELFNQETVFIPPFVQLQIDDFESNMKLIRQNGIRFPAVCKPVVAHGSSSAHQMTLIFKENGLKEISYPCVVQTFINHNATLYKLFCLGYSYTKVLRPSIKNFHNFEDMKPIRFDGGDISKANPTGDLEIQGNYLSNGYHPNEPCPKLLSLIVEAVGESMGLQLFGVDVIVEANTGRLAVVDVNSFPGYEGVTDFPERLADFVRNELDKQDKETHLNNATSYTSCDDKRIMTYGVAEPKSSSERLT